jgi:uncharacterized repeat protein (TIGR03943 family)
MDAHSHGTHAHEAHAHDGRVALWVQVVTILLVGGFLGFSYLSGRVRLFVVPAYAWFSMAGALLLAAMGVARVLAGPRGCGWCELHEHTPWRLPTSACAVLLVVPIVLVVAVNPRRYSPEGLRKRRIAAPPRDARFERAVDWVLGLDAAGKDAAAGPTALPKSPTVADVLAAAQEGRRAVLEGKFVTVLGQCDLPGGPRSKRFDLYRLVVTCCIADATAISIEVARRPSVDLEPGEWVRVEGIIRFDSRVDPSLPVVHATSTTRIPEPAEPYL